MFRFVLCINTKYYIVVLFLLTRKLISYFDQDSISIIESPPRQKHKYDTGHKYMYDNYYYNSLQVNNLDIKQCIDSL